MKRYVYSVRSPSGAHAVWGGDSTSRITVTSTPAFSKEVDSGLSPLTITLNAPFAYDGGDVVVGAVVETTCETESGTKLIHGGIIENIEGVTSAQGEAITVTVSPWVKQLSHDYFRDGIADTDPPARVFSSTDVTDILTYIIDTFRRNAAGFSRITYTGDSVYPSGTTVSLEVGLERYNDAIQRVKHFGPGDWFWYVDERGLFSYRNFGTTQHHIFTLGKEIETIQRSESIEDIANVVMFWNLQDAVDSALALERPGSDLSIQTWGRRVEIITDSKVTDLDTAVAIADAYLRENQGPIVTHTIQVSDGSSSTKGYDIESIQPGDTCEVRNLGANFPARYSIVRVDYAGESATLSLGQRPTRRAAGLGKSLKDLEDFVTQAVTTSPPDDMTPVP